MSQLNKLIGAMFLTLLLTINVHAAEDNTKRLFISMTSGDFKQNGMAMGIANAMQDAGVATTVFVGANSVKYTMKKGQQEVFGPTGHSIKDMMASLIKKGGTVMICGICAKYQEVKESDVLDGVKIIGGAEVYGGLFAPNTQALSF